MDPLPATIDPRTRSLHNEPAASSGIAPNRWCRSNGGANNDVFGSEFDFGRSGRDRAIAGRRHGPAASSSARPRAAAGAATATMGLTGWVPAFRVPAAGAATPPNFPSTISLYQQAFKNWAGDIAVDAAWTCAPKTPADVVTVVNWAKANAYKVRPRGMMHNWSPLTFTPGSSDNNVMLVDTTQYLTSVSIASGSPATVTAQTGVTMESLLTQLETAGYGLTATPAPGDLTLGGVLAINGHGAAIPATGETRANGSSYGSVSNLITSITAVVWDSGSSQYVLKTFARSSTACQALAHAHRSFVHRLRDTAGARQLPPALPELVRHRVGGPVRARVVDVLAQVLELHLELGPRRGDLVPVHQHAVGEGVDRRRRTSRCCSKQVNSPYNYSFSDNLPLVDHEPRRARSSPATRRSRRRSGRRRSPSSARGLIATGTWDIWGWSKNSLLYVQADDVARHRERLRDHHVARQHPARRERVRDDVQQRS